MTTAEAAIVEAEEKQTNPQVQLDKEVFNALLRKRVYASVALGVVPLPLVDFVGLTAIQIELVHALCKAYSIPFKKRAASSLISAIAGGAAPVLAAPIAFSLLKFVPVVGMGVAGVTLPVLFGASTYAVGRVVNSQLAKGKSLEDIDLDKAKEFASHYMEEGKKIAKGIAEKVQKNKAAPGPKE